MQEKEIQIFDATLRLFAEGNVIGKIKVIDIANKASIGKGTVYEYFKTKDEIFVKTIIYFIKKQRDVMLQSIKDENFEQMFFSSMGTANKIVVENRALFGMIMMSAKTYRLDKKYEEEIKTELKAVKKDLMDFAYSLVKKGQEENILSKDIDDKDIIFALIAITSAIQYTDDDIKIHFGKEMSSEEIYLFYYKKFVKLLN